MAIQVYIVEDHAIVRDLIGEMLAVEPDIAVRGAAASGEEALEELDGQAVDLVLVDTSLPGMSGIELTRRLREGQADLRCLAFSGHGEDPYVRKALAAGARGYVLKGTPDELARAIRTVMGGEIYLSEKLHGMDHPDTADFFGSEAA
jgi:DNA-binding NarL/FixJ family response regulator